MSSRHTAWGYDAADRLTSITYSDHVTPNVTAVGYDNATTITYPGTSHAVVRDFDDAGRMTTVTDWLSNTTTLHPDRDSNTDTITFPAASGLVDTVTLDNVDAVSSIADKAGTTTVAS